MTRADRSLIMDNRRAWRAASHLPAGTVHGSRPGLRFVTLGGMAKRNSASLLEVAAKRRAEADALEAQAAVLSAVDDPEGPMLRAIADIDKASTSLQKQMTSAAGDSDAVLTALDLLADAGRRLGKESAALHRRYAKKVGQKAAGPRSAGGSSGRTGGGPKRGGKLPPLPDDLSIVDDPEQVIDEFCRLSEYSPNTRDAVTAAWRAHLRNADEAGVSLYDFDPAGAQGERAVLWVHRIRDWMRAMQTASDPEAAADNEPAADTDTVDAESGPVSEEASAEPHAAEAAPDTAAPDPSEVETFESEGDSQTGTGTAETDGGAPPAEPAAPEPANTGTARDQFQRLAADPTQTPTLRIAALAVTAGLNPAEAAALTRDDASTGDDDTVTVRNTQTDKTLTLPLDIYNAAVAAAPAPGLLIDDDGQPLNADQLIKAVTGALETLENESS